MLFSHDVDVTCGLIITLIIYILNKFYVNAAFSFKDRKYETVILPVCGVATPFHISTIKVRTYVFGVCMDTFICYCTYSTYVGLLPVLYFLRMYVRMIYIQYMNDIFLHAMPIL